MAKRRTQPRPRVSKPAPASTPRAVHVAVFPGSFDPATFGHLDVIARGRTLFDSVVVGVGRNPGKEALFSIDERVAMLRELVDDLTRREPHGAPVIVEAFDDLTVDFARRVAQSHAGTDCTPILLRGIRNLSDLQSEVQQALTNRQVGGLETAFVVAGPDFAYTSSSLIRQITALGDPEQLRSMVPPSVIERLKLKKRRKHPVLMNLARVNAG